MLLEIPTQIRLSRIFEQFDLGLHRIFAEHTAIQVDDLEEALTYYNKLGYVTILKKDKVAFITRDLEIIELIPRDREEHFAYRVENTKLLEELRSHIFSNCKATFDIIDSSEETTDSTSVDEVRWFMIKDRDTLQCIQFIWRMHLLV